MDKTENIRRILTGTINKEVKSENPDLERTRLEKEYGEVWDTKEVQEKFTIEGFMAPFCIVTRREDNIKGTIVFQHNPRFYFNFKQA